MTQTRYMGYADHRCSCYKKISDHPVCNGCGILVGEGHVEPGTLMKGVIVNEMAQENERADFKIMRTGPMRLRLCSYCARESVSRTLNVPTRWVHGEPIVV